MFLSRKTPDLVVSEARPPGGMCGVALIGRVGLSYPATAVMLMTRLRDPPLDAAIPVLVKPFTAAALIERVNGLLAEGRRIAEPLTAAFGWSRAAKDELETIFSCRYAKTSGNLALAAPSDSVRLCASPERRFQPSSFRKTMPSCDTQGAASRRDAAFGFWMLPTMRML
jgi:hypothetical protein